MIFRTEINPDIAKTKIKHSNNISMIGSCFTQNIGEKLSQAGFLTDINPFGIIYNPITISDCIKRVSMNSPLVETDLIKAGEFWKSYSHHGDFRAETQKEILKTINKRIDYSNEFIKKSSFLIITLGSAWVYTHKETGRLMGNCHKLDQKLFDKSLLSVNQIVGSLKQSIDIFFETSEIDNPNIIFTISPVRHWKDGFRENQLSKSILHLACYELNKSYSQIHYFPSYEIMIDDLRDYRFYADDFLHPNNQAIDYIWDKFKTCFCSNETIDLCNMYERLHKMKEHRPFNSQSQAYKAHLQKIEELEKDLRDKRKHF